MGTDNERPVLITLSKEDLQELMEKAAVAGAKAGIDRYEAELKDRQKKYRDKRYHNTKLLLRNYRMLQKILFLVVVRWKNLQLIFWII